MKRLNVMIVDDEQLILDNMKFILKQFQEIHISYEFTDAFAALAQIQQTPDIDLIFVDISMPILNGLDFAERVFGIDPGIKIVFVTAYEKYAVDSFGVNTVDYILKPPTAARIQRVLDKIEKMSKGERKEKEPSGSLELDASVAKLVGMKNNQYFVIDPDEAYYIMALDRELLMYTKKEEYRLKHNISFWEGRLKGMGWIRCHRSFLINIDHIKKISPMFNSTYSISLEGREEEIPVSRSYIGEFKKALNL